VASLLGRRPAPTPHSPAALHLIGPATASSHRGGLRRILGGQRPASFVSGSLSPGVAIAHFHAGPATSTAALLRQPLPVDRLFMTFVETPAMNRQYLEAEAVLIGDPTSPVFRPRSRRAGDRARPGARSYRTCGWVPT
jgi:hypothetical protein